MSIEALARELDISPAEFARRVTANGIDYHVERLLAIGSPSPDEIAAAARELGLPVEAMLALVKKNGVHVEGEPAPSGIVALDLCDFLARDLPSRKIILSPWLLSQSLSMIYSWRGVGKTHVALGIAYAVATGTAFVGWQATEPVKTLYIDGEMPAAALQTRLANIVRASAVEPASGMLTIVTPDLQPGAMPDLATREGQRDIEGVIAEETKVIILDNLSCLVRRGGKENEAESWLTVAEWALAQRARGRSVVFIHHAGKDGNQRGTSKREDLLDAVIALRRPPGHVPQDGAVFEVVFEKGRDLRGKEIAPVEARLTEDADTKQQVWTTRPVENATFERVVELAGLGMRQNDIAVELGVHKSQVSRHLKKTKSEPKKRRVRKDIDD